MPTNYLKQIWAISRMSIGREIKSAQQWDDHFEFPLSRMWSRRLKSHKTFSTVEVVRKQLDNQDSNNVSAYIKYLIMGSTYIVLHFKVDKCT